MPKFNFTHRQLALMAIFLVMLVLTGFVVSANYAAANGDYSIYLPLIEGAGGGTLPQ